ncbi:hypothetical protein ACE7GA_15320 [Roseomonas sp. CCTCC AB2023176]|uniref:hypothetical protein n=1 Tax=Roseomonas sp. CCTCC AB2023176 TaxID=3342640 RepID=UPI0035DDFBCB
MALRFAIPGTDGRARFSVGFADAAGNEIPGGIRLLPRADGLTAVGFVPPDTAEARVERVGQAFGDAELEIRPIARWLAGFRLLADEPRRLRAFLPPWPRSPAALARRFRQGLITPVTQGDAVAEYRVWAALFDTWQRGLLPAPPGAPSLGMLLLSRDDRSPAATRSLASLKGLESAIPWAVALPDRWRDAAEALGTDYVGLLAPGEILPPWAAALAVRELSRAGRPPIALADEDALDAPGLRREPVFRPRPNRALMLSGTLAGGSGSCAGTCCCTTAPRPPAPPPSSASPSGSPIMRRPVRTGSACPTSCPTAHRRPSRRRPKPSPGRRRTISAAPPSPSRSRRQRRCG